MASEDKVRDFKNSSGAERRHKKMGRKCILKALGGSGEYFLVVKSVLHAE